jgi:uncharacterized protein YaaW (UPF0174 family)
MWRLAVPSLALLLACSPAQLADNVTRQAAESVVTPVLDDYMTGPQAQGATACILDNAAPAEIRALARDVATVAGTTTVQSVLTIGARPATLACLASVGAPILPRTGGF